jgi:hypothetical protein
MSGTSASRAFFLAALSVSLATALMAQTPVTQSSLASAIIRPDGQAAEWQDTPGVRDIKSGAKLAFQNDGRDLFILIVFQKPEARESLESTGLTILVRPAGSKKLERGVLFLMRPVPAETYIRWHESQGTFLTEGEKTKLRDAVLQDLCLTFAVGARGSIYGPLRLLGEESVTPEFAVSEDAAGTTYEIKIPLPSPDLVPGGLGASPGETVRISFEWGGASRKILVTKATRETPPAEKGGLSGVASPAQEFLNMFDSLSRPTMGTKEFSFAVDVKLAKID